MGQILMVKYTNEEERIVLGLNVLGISIGIPLGVGLGFLLGFFNDITSAAFSSVEWTLLMLKSGSVIVPLTWIGTITVFFLFWKRRNGRQFRQEIKKEFVGTLFLPLTIAFGFLVLALVIFPISFILLEYINRPLLVMLIDLLVFLPFVILFGALILPETPAGKALRRYAYRLDKRKK